MDQSAMFYMMMQNNGNNGNGGNDMKNLFMTFLNNMMQMLLIALISNIKNVGVAIKNIINTYIENKTQKLFKDNIIENITNNVKKYNIGSIHEIYTITLKYKSIREKVDSKPLNFNNDTNTNYKYFKYIFNYLIELKHINELFLTRENVFPSIINIEIELEKDIYCIIKSLEISGTFEPISCEIDLFSKSYNTNELYKFLHKLEKKYLDSINNKLYDNTYIFELINTSKTNIDPRGILDHTGRVNEEMSLQNEPKNVLFSMAEYSTSKNFENMIGENSKVILKKLNHFINNKSWYYKKGIPHHLGILLSGIPGSGKTSAIKAIANYTKRHIINVNFKNIKTKQQFYNLLTKNKLYINNNENEKQIDEIILPIEKRIYVLEEIDCLGDIILKRDKTKNVEVNSNYKLSLEDLLIILDGTIEYPGRIVIFTTNHPEKLDDALIRGGRIDLNIKYSYSTKNEIREYIEFYYETKLDEKYKNEIMSLPESYITYASLTQFCFSNEIHEAIDALLKFNKNKENEIEEIKKENEIEEIKKENKIDEIKKENEIEEIKKENKIYEIKKENEDTSISESIPLFISQFKEKNQEVRENYKENYSNINAIREQFKVKNISTLGCL